MKNLLIILLVVFIGCKDSEVENIDQYSGATPKDSIGGMENVFNAHIVENTNEQFVIMTSSASIEVAQKIVENGVKFNIVKNKLGEITYKETTDSSFITPEGLKVGDRWIDIPQVFKDRVVKETGWRFYILLDSGWRLGFCVGITCTEEFPDKDTKIQFVFKK